MAARIRERPAPAAQTGAFVRTAQIAGRLPATDHGHRRLVPAARLRDAAALSRLAAAAVPLGHEADPGREAPHGGKVGRRRWWRRWRACNRPRSPVPGGEDRRPGLPPACPAPPAPLRGPGAPPGRACGSGPGTEGAARLPVALGVMPLAGEHGADARHGGEGGQGAGHCPDAVRRPACRCVLAAVAAQATGTPSPSTATWHSVPRLARSAGFGSVRSPPRLARTEQLSRIGSGRPRSMPTGMAWVCANRPASARLAKQRRRVEPPARSPVAARLRHGLLAARRLRPAPSPPLPPAAGAARPRSRPPRPAARRTCPSPPPSRRGRRSAGTPRGRRAPSRRRRAAGCAC